jgi:hypothetical protein
MKPRGNLRDPLITDAGRFVMSLKYEVVHGEHFIDDCSLGGGIIRGALRILVFLRTRSNQTKQPAPNEVLANKPDTYRR